MAAFDPYAGARWQTVTPGAQSAHDLFSAQSAASAQKQPSRQTAQTGRMSDMTGGTGMTGSLSGSSMPGMTGGMSGSGSAGMPGSAGAMASSGGMLPGGGRISTRNLIPGRVAAITPMMGGSMVTVDIGGGRMLMVAVMSDSMSDMRLQMGSQVVVVADPHALLLTN